MPYDNHDPYWPYDEYMPPAHRTTIQAPLFPRPIIEYKQTNNWELDSAIKTQLKRQGFDVRVQYKPVNNSYTKPTQQAETVDPDDWWMNADFDRMIHLQLSRRHNDGVTIYGITKKKQARRLMHKQFYIWIAGMFMCDDKGNPILYTGKTFLKKHVHEFLAHPYGRKIVTPKLIPDPWGLVIDNVKDDYRDFIMVPVTETHMPWVDFELNTEADAANGTYQELESIVKDIKRKSKSKLL